MEKKQIYASPEMKVFKVKVQQGICQGSLRGYPGFPLGDPECDPGDSEADFFRFF